MLFVNRYATQTFLTNLPGTLILLRLNEVLNSPLVSSLSRAFQLRRLPHSNKVCFACIAGAFRFPGDLGVHQKNLVVACDNQPNG